MKILLLLTVSITLSISTFAQQTHWVKQQGGNSLDQTNDIATDANGNIYAVGTFDATANFGNDISLTTEGSLDIFVAKYDSNGTCLWAKKAGGQFGDEGRSVAVDNAGNIYVTGIYGQAGATFGDITVATLGGIRNGFVAKYSNVGNILWVKAIGGTSSSPEPLKIEVGGDGSIFLAGDFYGNITFDGQQAISSTQQGGLNDVFIAKFNSSGDVLWAKRGGNRKLEKVTGLAVDKVGNALLYGSFDSLTTFNGSTKYAEYAFTGGNAHYDMFLVKYSSTGEQLWFNTFGGGDEDKSGGICVDDANNIYTTGYFKFDFVSGTINTFGNGGFNLFIHKLNSAGTPLWMKYANNSGSGYKMGLDMTCTGNQIWMAGYFGATLTIGNVSMTGNGENNPMLIKYDTSGTAAWGMFGNCPIGRVSQGLSVAVSGNKYYYAGYIYGNVNFNSTSVTAPGVYSDGFICAVTADIITPPVVATPASISASSITTSSIQLSWNGTSAEYRVLKKINSSSVSPTDGDLVYEGTEKSFTLSGLTANTAYFITVYGKAEGSATYSADNKKIAATTVSDDPDSNVVLGFLAGETSTRTFGETGVKISITGASGSDGNIRVDLNTVLSNTGTLPVNIDSIFESIYWRITATGLSGGSLRYCITLDVTDVWGLVDFAKYHILKRPNTGAAWEDLMANSSYTVTYSSPEITVCGLSSFSEFAIGMGTINNTGISESLNVHIGVYPNPATSYIYADVSKISVEEIQLINMQGKVVRIVSTGNKNIIRIDKENLMSGIYLLKAGNVVTKVMFTD